MNCPDIHEAIGDGGPVCLGSRSASSTSSAWAKARMLRSPRLAGVSGFDPRVQASSR